MCVRVSTACIFTLSLHDALPISPNPIQSAHDSDGQVGPALVKRTADRNGPLADRHFVFWSGCRDRKFLVSRQDRKSTRLNSSHRCISYAVFCLKKKKAGASTTSR